MAATRSFSSLSFKAVDKIFLIYNVLVLLLILLFGSMRPDFGALVVWHIALIGLVLTLVVCETVSGGAFTRLLRYAYPALLLPFIHYESGILSPLVTEGYFDSLFVSLDRFLFGGDVYAWLAPNLGGPLINELMNGAYFAFYLMITGLLLCTYLFRRDWADELIFVLTLCLYSHYFFFILFPVIGPTHLRPELFSAQEGLIAPLVYRLIENGDTAGGAFPSSHCAGVLLLNLYAGRIFGSRVACNLMPITVLVFLSSIYLSMHYAIDSIVGLIVGVLFFYFGPRLYRRLSSSGIVLSHILKRRALPNIQQPSDE